MPRTTRDVSNSVAQHRRHFLQAFSAWSLRVPRGVVRVLADHSFNRRSRKLSDGGMTVNRRMLRRIAQGAKSGGEWGCWGRQFYCVILVIDLPSVMIVLDTLHQLPLKEKLFVMEALWDDLSQTEAGLPVPQWHQDLLDERESQISAGTAKFIDWEVAKQEILAAVK
jgi:hypothetical protein